MEFAQNFPPNEVSGEAPVGGDSPFLMRSGFHHLFSRCGGAKNKQAKNKQGQTTLFLVNIFER